MFVFMKGSTITSLLLKGLGNLQESVFIVIIRRQDYSNDFSNFSSQMRIR